MRFDTFKGRRRYLDQAIKRGDSETARIAGKKGGEATAKKKAEEAPKKEALKAPNTASMKDAPKPDPVRFQEELDKRYP